VDLSYNSLKFNKNNIPFTKKNYIFVVLFCLSWEQRKLGEESLYIVAGGDVDNSKLLSDGIYPVIANALTDDGIVGYYANDFRMQAPAVTVTGRGNVGHAKARKVNFTPIVRLLVIKTEHDVDFLENAINKQGFIVESTGVPQLTVPNIEQMEICFPQNRKEEYNIGKIFLCLDNLVTLHQCKPLGKRRMNLQIKNEKITYSWEQRKARELFVSFSDKGYPELPVLSATQDSGMVRRDDTGKNIFHDKTNEIGYKRVLPGQFVIHLRSFQGGFAHSSIEGITSPAYTIFGFLEPEKHCDYYWKYVFSSKDFIRRLETVTYGIRDGRSISYDEFLTMTFKFPSRHEQEEISSCLCNLDNLITLHQRNKKINSGEYYEFKKRDR
jgi:type I restriction enzyme S subunit